MDARAAPSGPAAGAGRWREGVRTARDPSRTQRRASGAITGHGGPRARSPQTPEDHRGAHPIQTVRPVPLDRRRPFWRSQTNGLRSTGGRRLDAVSAARARSRERLIAVTGPILRQCARACNIALAETVREPCVRTPQRGGRATARSARASRSPSERAGFSFCSHNISYRASAGWRARSVRNKSRIRAAVPTPITCEREDSSSSQPAGCAAQFSGKQARRRLDARERRFRSSSASGDGRRRRRARAAAFMAAGAFARDAYGSRSCNAYGAPTNAASGRLSALRFHEAAASFRAVRTVRAAAGWSS